MSWKIINRILGLAAINSDFRQQLQEDPLAALETQNVEITREELEALKAFASLPFPQFCQRLTEKFSEMDASVE